MKEYSSTQTREMAQDLREGKILAFPTDTVYGVGTIYGNPKALERLKTIKKRPETKPIPMMVSRLEQAEGIIELNDTARKLAARLLPGALTLIVPLTEQADRLYTNGKDTAALRIPNVPVLLEVMDQLELPLMVSSANLSGQPAALTKREAMDMLPGLDGILDGPCVDNQASTIVDCTTEPIRILRQGPVSMETLLEALAD